VRVAVIGGGAAGLMAAAFLPPSIETVIFERGGRPGRKLLLSGSGRCNFTHRGNPEDLIPRYGDNGRFLRPALYEFPPDALIEFFAARGLPAVVREDGKVFPASCRARDVLDLLLRAASGARLMPGARVTEVARTASGFLITAEGLVAEADSVVLATGGVSYPGTGSSGDGLDIARRLGHRIVPPRPALCGAASGGFSFLAGNGFPGVGAALFRNGRVARRGSGDLLFTHAGVSGPLGLNLARHILPGDILAFNFLHPGDPEEFLSGFASIVKREPSGKTGSLLAGFPLSRALADFMLAAAGISREKRRGDLSGQEMRRLGELLVRFPVPVESVEGFDAAMVTAGGVALGEVNPKTLESRIVPGLHFAGEVLDIDGDTGGYNLHAAFATGRLAALSIARRTGQTSTALS